MGEPGAQDLYVRFFGQLWYCLCSIHPFFSMLQNASEILKEVWHSECRDHRVSRSNLLPCLSFSAEASAGGFTRYPSNKCLPTKRQIYEMGNCTDF